VKRFYRTFWNAFLEIFRGGIETLKVFVLLPFVVEENIFYPQNQFFVRRRRRIGS
jgi:hypothetical protein